MGRKRKIPYSYKIRPWFQGDVSSDSEDNGPQPQRPCLVNPDNQLAIHSDPPSEPASSSSFQSLTSQASLVSSVNTSTSQQNVSEQNEYHVSSDVPEDLHDDHSSSDVPEDPRDDHSSSDVPEDPRDDHSSSDVPEDPRDHQESSDVPEDPRDHQESSDDFPEDLNDHQESSDDFPEDLNDVPELPCYQGSQLISHDQQDLHSSPESRGSDELMSSPLPDVNSGPEDDLSPASGVQDDASGVAEDDLGNDDVENTVDDDGFDDPEFLEVSADMIEERDYHSLLEELSGDWLKTELDHHVSKTATDIFWRLACTKIVKLFEIKSRQNIKRKLPQFQQIRRNLCNNIPPIKMELGFINKETGQLEIHENLDKTPVKRFPPSKFQKAYEISSIEVSFRAQGISVTNYAQSLSQSTY